MVGEEEKLRLAHANDDYILRHSQGIGNAVATRFVRLCVVKEVGLAGHV